MKCVINIHPKNGERSEVRQSPQINVYWMVSRESGDTTTSPCKDQLLKLGKRQDVHLNPVHVSYNPKIELRQVGASGQAYDTVLRIEDFFRICLEYSEMLFVWIKSYLNNMTSFGSQDNDDLTGIRLLPSLRTFRRVKHVKEGKSNSPVSLMKRR